MKSRRLIAIPMLLVVIFLFGFQTTKNDNPNIPSFTDKTGYWIDTTGQVDQKTLDTLEAESLSIQEDGYQLIGAFFDTCSNEIEFVNDIGNQNRIGDKDKDNGIVVGVFLGNTSSSGESPTIAITAGDGLQSILNDAKIGRFLDEYFVPARSDGKWQQGVIDTVKALHQYLQTPYADEFRGINGNDVLSKKEELIILAIIIIIVVILSVFGKSKGGGSFGRSSGSYSGSSSSSIGHGGGFNGGGASR